MATTTRANVHGEEAERVLLELRRLVAEYGLAPEQFEALPSEARRLEAWRVQRDPDGKQFRSYEQWAASPLPWGLCDDGLPDRRLRRVRGMLRADDAVRRAFYAGLIGLELGARLGAHRGDGELAPAVEKLSQALPAFRSARDASLRRRIRSEVHSTLREVLARVTRPRARPSGLPRVMSLLPRLVRPELDRVAAEVAKLMAVMARDPAVVVSRAEGVSRT